MREWSSKIYDIKSFLYAFANFLWRRRSSGKWLCSLVVTIVVIAISCFFLILWLDPYICFHRAVGVRQTYSDSYATIPGMLRHFPCDTVLIGSSMCQNFRISEINRILHCHALKATASGMTGDDANRILRVLLTEKPGELKRVLLGLDSWSYLGAENGHWRERKYLYDLPFSWEYFFSMDSVSAAFNVIVTNLAPAGTRGAELEKDFDRMFGDKVWRFDYSRTSLENELRCPRRIPPPLRLDTLELMERLVLIPLGTYPGKCRIDIFLPPYSIYFWIFLQEKGFLKDYLKVRQGLAEKISGYPNIVLHDFQTDPDIICNLDYYKDLTHYSPEVNTKILSGIASGKYVSGPEQIRSANIALGKLIEQSGAAYRKIRNNTQSGSSH